ncbi:hypothetical protein FB45DRAFT_872772 [Roridomyces roridus]|uniref:Uncharacterized protein n=1 Tax=Roridomyces roridus TaxID=1738132 RepID=A0AAD7BDC5_9AGAR|nr:hypothetical protein FB45DRAFT_872772 [Roridomyces roridus]
MSTVGEISGTASMLQTTPTPTDATNIILLAIAILLLVGCTLQLLSTVRLTAMLVSNMRSAEEAYFGALEIGVLDDTHTEILVQLQFRVCEIRQQTLRNSRTLVGGLRELLKGRALTIIRCIRDVKLFETEIEVSPSFCRLGQLTEQRWPDSEGSALALHIGQIFKGGSNTSIFDSDMYSRGNRETNNEVK